MRSVDSMTREELEAEVDYLRQAVTAAATEADSLRGEQAQRDHRYVASLTLSQRQTIDANRRAMNARSDADLAAQAHERSMAKATADLVVWQRVAAELEESQRALSTSEARQRAIFDNATDIAMIVTDPRGIITDWNPGAENILQWAAEEICGDGADRFFTPEDRAHGRVKHEMITALQTGCATDERWHLRKNGERFWASGEMLPLLDEAKNHLGFVKILRDRTREHLAGAELKTAQERFQTIIETIDAAFAIVEVKFDADDRPVNYRFLEANAQFEQQAGVNLRGKWVTEFAPDLEQFWFETYGHVAKTGEPANFENYAEAFERWFDVRAVRVGDPADRQIAILFNDVTARREAQDKLRASEALARENIERVQLALEAGAIIGTWHWDIPTDRFTIDRAFALAFGLDPALGHDGIPLAQIVATVHPDDQAGLAEAINAAIANGGSYAHQYRVRHADGDYRWIEANGRVDRDENGIPQTFPGVLIDISERRKIEEELRESESFMRSVLAASTDCIKVLDLDGNLTFMSEGGMKVMEVSDFNAVKGCYWPNLLKDGGVGLGREALEAAKKGQTFHFEAPGDTLLGTTKFWSVSVSPIFGENGRVERILSVSRDHTTIEEAREQQRLLNGELSHRLKNVLTIVQSIANQTLRDAQTLEDASAAFSSRLASLGRATDVLTATSWEASDLVAVLEAGLTVLGGRRNRVTLDGPAVRLNPQSALALTLAVHELGTNAMKYGSLSNETGTVSLDWKVGGSAANPEFLLLWQEHDGPPVAPPTRKGFGSRMIERSLRSYFRGETALSYPVEGVQFRIKAPLSGAGELVTA